MGVGEAADLGNVLDEVVPHETTMSSAILLLGCLVLTTKPTLVSSPWLIPDSKPVVCGRWLCLHGFVDGSRPLRLVWQQ